MTERADLKLASRAEETLQQIVNASPRGQVKREVFTRLKQLPAMLRTSGVAATLAFYAAKSGTSGVAHAYSIVGTELRRQVWLQLGEDSQDWARLFTRLQQADQHQRMAAYANLEHFAGWLRRLAQALQNEQAIQRARGDDSRDAETTVGEQGGGDG